MIDCEQCRFVDYDSVCIKCSANYELLFEKIESVDWNKVPIDTPIQSKSYDSDSWKDGYFCIKINDNVQLKYAVFSNGEKHSKATNISLVSHVRLRDDFMP